MDNQRIAIFVWFSDNCKPISCNMEGFYDIFLVRSGIEKKK